MFTYITEIGSIYLCQNNLRPVHNQAEFPKAFYGVLLIEPLQKKQTKNIKMGSNDMQNKREATCKQSM